jgi:hypothetical protein
MAKKKKSDKENIKAVLMDIVDELYRHNILSEIVAEHYIKVIEEI